ncbi:enos interacting domain containing protein [Babesia caballi]|uniref:Enos interacting domain containg protein n=1 Tax=Babesia caballi TaxID=5871 RepID=A0AAV4LWW1_BABCB|nr:enos interacting domain containg protein [Babesia caballi]
MTRHSKNNTANPIFTYHERRKVKDFNTLRQRLGADSMRKCEHCWLCLSTAIKPVCTPAGYVFCKECILKCFEKQLTDHKRQVEDWKARAALQQAKRSEEAETTRESLKRQLVDSSVFGVNSLKTAKRRDTYDKADRDSSAVASDSSFWVAGAPGRADSNAKSVCDAGAPPKLKTSLKCPITGKPLKLRDLVDVHPDTAPESDDPDAGLIWVCSVSQRPISHNPALLDRATGRLVLKRYVEVADGENKFITLIPGGTGFAAHNGVLADKYRPALL